MRIRAMQVKSSEKARRILSGYRTVHTREGSLPGRAWWRVQPGGPGVSKLYILAFQPKAGELACDREPWLDPAPGARERELLALARHAVAWIEERKGVRLNWAAGIRLRSRQDPVTDVWLFMYPWTLKRRWWNLTREDLSGLNAFMKTLLGKI